MTRKRNLCKTFKVKGVLVEAVTIAGLARIVGKSKDTILRYESKDIFPLAPLMVGDVRYYPLSLAKKLTPLVAQIPRNKKVDAELVAKINRIFKEERNKLCQ